MAKFAYIAKDASGNETRGTMHGFDIVQKAKTTKIAIRARTDFNMDVLFCRKEEYNNKKSRFRVSRNICVLFNWFNYS